MGSESVVPDIAGPADGADADTMGDSGLAAAARSAFSGVD
jgi:hypothetical protein